MAEEELDALVVRAPDNVLYLTNFWGMKGYDACVFPREGEPVLITIEASEEDAARTAWTEDVRLIRGYDPEDPRPPLARTLDAAVAAARDYERVGLELSLGTQASDRMVGEPTTFTAAWFDALPGGGRRDAAPRPRALAQDRAGARAAAARERARGGGDGSRPRAAPSRDAGGAGGRALAGLRARRGHGLPRPGRARAPVLADLGRAAGSRRSPRPATCPSSRASPSCSRSGSAPTATGPTTRRTSSSAS